MRFLHRSTRTPNAWRSAPLRARVMACSSVSENQEANPSTVFFNMLLSYTLEVGYLVDRILAMRVLIRNLSKSFGSTTALKGVSLEIASQELFFLLGPSGCGKTT